jgi:hypothetical protein
LTNGCQETNIRGRGQEDGAAAAVAEEIAVDTHRQDQADRAPRREIIADWRRSRRVRLNDDQIGDARVSFPPLAPWSRWPVYWFVVRYDRYKCCTFCQQPIFRFS